MHDFATNKLKTDSNYHTMDMAPIAQYNPGIDYKKYIPCKMATPVTGLLYRIRDGVSVPFCGKHRTEFTQDGGYMVPRIN